MEFKKIGPLAIGVQKTGQPSLPTKGVAKAQKALRMDRQKAELQKAKQRGKGPVAKAKGSDKILH